MIRRFPALIPIAALMGVILMALAPASSTLASSSSSARSAQQAAAGSGGNPLSTIGVTGRAGNGGSFDGSVDIQSFTVQHNKPVATGLLSGTLVEASGQTRTVTSQPVTMPIGAQGSCDVLTLTFGPTHTTVQGSAVDLSAARRSVTDQTVPRSVLCAAAHLLASKPSPGALAAILSRVMYTSDAATTTVTTLAQVPITGTLNSGGNFTGAFTIRQFASEHQKLATHGVLNGTVTDMAGRTVPITNQNVTLPLAITGTCTSLALSLGPQHVQLQGQGASVGPAHITFAPRQVPRQVMCALAQLLNTQAPTGLITQALNRVLNMAGTTPGVPSQPGLPVTGAVAGGGSFDGTLDLRHVTTHNGALAATGVLTGTLTEASGATRTVTSQPATLPLTAQGSCKVLTFSLGPARVPIQGRMVDLSGAHRSITAQAVPGNLLCAAAHLLNTHAPASVVAHALDRVLSAAH